MEDRRRGGHFVAHPRRRRAQPVAGKIPRSGRRYIIYLHDYGSQFGLRLALEALEQVAHETMTPVARMVTIGVYGFSGAAFLERLRCADVSLVLDVRQRRGVRGSDYVWANSRRLQAALADAGIGYEHHLELAPTTELRQLQYREDDRRGVGKRSRRELAPEYTRRYLAEILDRADLNLDHPGPEQWNRGAALCRARSRGLPPLTDRRAAGQAPRRLDRAPASN